MSDKKQAVRLNGTFIGYMENLYLDNWNWGGTWNPRSPEADRLLRMAAASQDADGSDRNLVTLSDYPSSQFTISDIDGDFLTLRLIKAKK